jgi:hypothetical protein
MPITSLIMRNNILSRPNNGLIQINRGSLMALEKVLSYFKNVQALLEGLSGSEGRGGEDVEEQRRIIVENAFAELAGYELRLSCHHDGSFLVEGLLKDAALVSDDQVCVFSDALGAAGLRRLMLHRYGSHVAEALLCRYIPGYLSYETCSDEDGGEGCDDLVCDTYGSKVLRRAMEHHYSAESSAHCKQLEQSFLGPLFAHVDFVALAMDTNGTMVLQDALRLVPHLLDPQPLIGHLDTLAPDKNGSRVLEALFLCGHFSDKIFASNLLKGKVAWMYQDRTANHVLQLYISSATDADILNGLAKELAAEELQDKLLLHPGVLCRLLAKSIQVANVQKPALNLFQAAFQVPSLKEHLSRDKILQVVALSSEPVGQDFIFKPLGCQVLQHVLDLSKHAAKAFAGLSGDLLDRLATNKDGSRLLEHFMNGKHCPASFVDQIVASVSLPVLARCRYGSHVLETLYAKASASQKTAIMTTLKPKLKVILASPHGQLVAHKLRLEEFVHNPQRWHAWTEQTLRKRQMFADLLSSGDGK